MSREIEKLTKEIYQRDDAGKGFYKFVCLKGIHNKALYNPNDPALCSENTCPSPLFTPKDSNSGHTCLNCSNGVKEFVSYT